VGLFDHVDLKLDWRSLTVLRREVVPDLSRLWSLTYYLMRRRR